MSDKDRMEYMNPEMREWFENITPERRSVITHRVEKRIVDTVGEWNDNTDPVLVETAFIEVAGKMWAQSLLDGLLEDGLIFVSGTNDDGELLYAKVDE